MKRFCLVLVAILATAHIIAQTPQAFKYQAIARDETGNILSNWDIGIRISILEEGKEGNSVYCETHLVKSNPYGIINLVIGEGSFENGEGKREKGEFSEINWGEARYYIKLEMDIEGEGNYKEMGTTQLYAVPYALYADEAGKLKDQSEKVIQDKPASAKRKTTSGSITSNNRTRNGPPNSKISSEGDSHLNAITGNLGVGTTSPAEMLDVNGNIVARGKINAEEGLIIRDSDGNPREVILNPDGTWSTKFHCEGYIRDIRDGKLYNIKKIGTQCWMTENLNIGNRMDGDAPQTDNENLEKYCYDNNEANCDIYGGMYQWNEMMQYSTHPFSRGICPAGWHIPLDYEWDILINLYGGTGTAGGALKEIGETHWNDPNEGATNTSGFTALPGGECHSPTAAFLNLGDYATFWSNAPDNTDALRLTLFNTSTTVHLLNVSKNWGFSVRCIKNFECGDSITDPRDWKNYGTVQIGNQCWMSQNLNIGTRIDGSEEQTNTGTIEKYCYDDIEDNCDIYGGLYQWNEMMQYVTTEGTQGICPPGHWYLPTDVAFTNLITHLGGTSLAGGKAKSTGTVGAGTGLWLDPNAGASNESGFTGLPAGIRDHSSKSFFNEHTTGRFWSSTQNTTEAWHRILHNYSAEFTQHSMDKTNGFSVRCILD